MSWRSAGLLAIVTCARSDAAGGDAQQVGRVVLHEQLGAAAGFERQRALLQALERRIGQVFEEADTGKLAHGQVSPRAGSCHDPNRIGLTLGRRLAVLYRVWNCHPVRLDRLAEQLLRWLGVADEPMRKCCIRLAEAVMAWGGHPYHSAAHHAEVAVNAMVIAALEGTLNPCDSMLLLAAALAHDLGYDPARPRAPFTAEAASADAADAIAQACGLSGRMRDDLRCLILATEPSARPRLLGPMDALPPCLADLARLRPLAAMLSDADLLSSAGLTVRWHQVQRARLERELGRSISAAADLAWFDQVVGPRFLSAGGNHFTGNLRRIREAAAHAG